MALTACIDNTWQVWRSAVNSSHNSKFWNCVHSFLLVMINQHVTLSQYCLLSLSTKGFANYCFSSFAYLCEIKGLQLLLFERGCVVWWKYVLDVGHRQTLYPCDGWPVLYCVFVTTNFIFKEWVNNCWWGWQNRTVLKKCIHLYDKT